MAEQIPVGEIPEHDSSVNGEAERIKAEIAETYNRADEILSVKSDFVVVTLADFKQSTNSVSHGKYHMAALRRATGFILSQSKLRYVGLADFYESEDNNPRIGLYTHPRFHGGSLETPDAYRTHAAEIHPIPRSDEIDPAKTAGQLAMINSFLDEVEKLDPAAKRPTPKLPKLVPPDKFNRDMLIDLRKPESNKYIDIRDAA